MGTNRLERAVNELLCELEYERRMRLYAEAELDQWKHDDRERSPRLGQWAQDDMEDEQWPL